jgi:hypothetical protein
VLFLKPFVPIYGRGLRSGCEGWGLGAIGGVSSRSSSPRPSQKTQVSSRWMSPAQSRSWM